MREFPKATITEKGERAALVSLARAGTPVGILIKRYLKTYYHADVTHASVSIIRGRGIDEKAMAWLLERHAPEDLQFVDGWTGKGAIQGQLQQAMQAYPGVSPGLAVLSDPACLAEKWGTFSSPAPASIPSSPVCSAGRSTVRISLAPRTFTVRCSMTNGRTGT